MVRFQLNFFLIAALKTLNRLNKEGEALALQDDLTTHPTLALMRRILADAQVTSANSKRASQYESNRITFNLFRLSGHNQKYKSSDDYNLITQNL